MVDDKPKAKDINAEWIASDEGSNAAIEIAAIVGYSSSDWIVPDLTLELLGDASDELIKKAHKSNRLRLTYVILVDQFQMTLLEDDNCCAVRWYNHTVRPEMIVDIQDKTRLITETTALLAVREWLDKEKK